MCELKLFITGAILTFARCITSLKIEVRSSGLVDHEPPPGITGLLLKELTTVGVLDGHPIELYCTGEKAQNLFISETVVSTMNYNRLESDIVNSTTRMHYIRTPERLLRPNVYTCSVDDIYTNVPDEVQLIIGTIPQIQNFTCLWDFGDHFVTCNWYSRNEIGYYELSTKTEGSELHLCKEYALGPSSCNFHGSLLIFISGYYDHFHFHACTFFGCNDQMYDIMRTMTMKLSPPSNFALESKGSRYAVLQWKDYSSYKLLSEFEVLYKLEYWITGMEPRVIHSSPEKGANKINKLRIDLPCALKFYTVRVSAKAADEDFNEDQIHWSDYSYVSFYTEPTTDGVEDTDPVCQLPGVELNGPVMKYEAQKFREEEVRKRLSEMKPRIYNLKKKAAEIQKFRDDL